MAKYENSIQYILWKKTEGFLHVQWDCISKISKCVCVCVHTCTHMCVTKLWLTPSLICGSQVSLRACCVRYLLIPIKSDLAFSLRLLWKDTHLKRLWKQPQLCLKVDLDHSKNTFWKTFLRLFYLSRRQSPKFSQRIVIISSMFFFRLFSSWWGSVLPLSCQAVRGNQQPASEEREKCT